MIAIILNEHKYHFQGVVHYVNLDFKNVLIIDSMKKILCLTDFSKNAEFGILYANALAEKFSSTLTFMHTFKFGKGSEDKKLHPALSYHTDTESRDKLNELCMNFRKKDKYSKVNYQFLVKEGDVVTRINEIIDDQKIDVLILSKEGELKPNDLYYGNVVTEIVNKAKCPVIVVPVYYTIKPDRI